MEQRAEFPRSRRVYVQGSREDVRVPVREVAVSSTDGDAEPALQLYDTRGFHSDPAIAVDVRRGLPELRSHWIRERDDVETIEGRRAGAEDDGKRGSHYERWA